MSRLTNRTRALLGGTLLTGLVLAVPAPASALSCVQPSGVFKHADTAFTGRITDAEKGRITVAVEEIWKGGPVLKEVVLKTELDGWWSIADGGTTRQSIPDGYNSEKLWLFAPRTNAKHQSVVNPCTAWDDTTPWEQELRPATVTYPEQVQVPESPADGGSVVSATIVEEDQSGPARLVLWAGVGVLVASVGALILAIRRSRSQSTGG